ncbi:MAG: UrcA family protein [Sphingomonas sp.]|jgi:UrcA family protein|uniref:UrcA family protein n=1 Tax=Sphingomonas sp. TaxID=28214 RepID=UPI0035683B69
MLKSVLAGIGVITILGASAVALQAGYDDSYRPQSLAVSHAGLDLTSPAGVALLQERVERAVRRVCEGDSGSFYDDGDEQQCRDDAWAGARPQIWAAIDAARRRPVRWAAERQPTPRRWAAPPPRRDWAGYDDEERAGYVSAPPPAAPAPAPIPIPPRSQPSIALSGVLGGPIDGAIAQAFQTGEATRWRDRGWHGVVQVSESREVWPNICRTVTIVRQTPGGWNPVRAGNVCLGRDGALHNSERY